MRIILEFCSESLADKRIPLEPGRTLRVGRRPEADVSCPDDPNMSGLHFLVAYDAAGCRIEDLKSRNGTFVNGVRVNSGTLKAGDAIRAGNTICRVHIENTVVQGPGEARTPQDMLVAVFRERCQPLYGLFDAARDTMIPALLFNSAERYQSLYEGAQGDELSLVAPYLVGLPPESPLLEPLVRLGWGKSWGVFLTCGQPFDEVRKHLRQFLMAKHPDGKQVYFRFYDPRVMRVFIPTCTPQEGDEFFGPVKFYIMEDENPGILLVFSNRGQGPAVDRISLEPEEQRSPRKSDSKGSSESMPPSPA
jgi:pSer/pThr/pTyr-binding forkhead associated (FHA) protein